MLCSIVKTNHSFHEVRITVAVLQNNLGQARIKSYESWLLIACSKSFKGGGHFEANTDETPRTRDSVQDTSTLTLQHYIGEIDKNSSVA